MIPFTTFVRISIPFASTFGKFFVIASSTAPIIFLSVPRICPAALSTPVRRLVIRLLATSAQSVSSNAIPNAEITFQAASIRKGTPFTIPVINDVTNCNPCSTSLSAFPASKFKFIVIMDSPCSIKAGIPFITFPIIGRKFPTKNVCTVSCKSNKGCCISFPSERFPTRFLAAAFIAIKEPVKVVAASFAVVPVIPNSPCITWIAE